MLTNLFLNRSSLHTIYKMLITVLLLSTVTHLSRAQVIRFPDEPDGFIAELSKQMAGVKNVAYDSTSARLSAAWTSSMNQQQQASFIVTAKNLAKRGIKMGPSYWLLARNTTTLLQTKGDIDGYLRMMEGASSKYDPQTLQRLLETVRIVVEEKQLYKSANYKLYLTSGAYRFRFDDSKPDTGVIPKEPVTDGWDTPADSLPIILAEQALPEISGALLDLKNVSFAMVAYQDSVTFGPSEGSVSLREGTFVGKDGKFDWSMGVDSSSYVSLGKYSFNIASPRLAVPVTQLYYPHYLQEPVAGSFEFRGMKTAPNKPALFPRFRSLKNNVTLSLYQGNVLYNGGLMAVRDQLSGISTDEEPAMLTVKKDSLVAFRAWSKKFVMADSVLVSDLAAVAIVLGADSVYHPGVRLRYNNEYGMLRLERADKTAFATLPYVDGYHKMYIWPESMRWSFAKGEIDFYMVAGKKEAALRVESHDYFRKERFQYMVKEYGFQPLNMASGYIQAQKKSTFTPEDLARHFKRDVVVIRKALQTLTLEGFFNYHAPSDQYRLSRKGVMYVMANIDKSDYDNFQIISRFQTNEEIANATINLKDTLLTIRGVESFIVSDSLKISATPSDKKVVIGKNRSFTLNGQMISSNFRFTGRGLKFNYDQFFVNMNEVDSITYTPQEKYAQGMSAEVGGHVNYDKGGTFYLSDPKNKSGKQKGGKSPRMVVEDGMTVYFDQPIRGKMTYPREVFFKVPSLDIDNLDKRDIVFNGVFNSDGITEPINTTLKSMEDNSLGFSYTPPSGQLKLYDQKATMLLKSPLTMDNRGLFSTGTLNYLTASFAADSALFTTDSLFAQGTTASIKEGTINKAYFPAVGLSSYTLNWFPQQDSLLLTTREKDFDFYNATTSFAGNLLLRSSGLYGNGKITRKDSEFTSTDIRFDKTGLKASNAEFKVAGKNKEENPVLLGRGVDVNFDIVKNKAILSSKADGFVSDSSGFEFPYAAYRTSITEATWDLTKKQVLLKGDVKNSTFTALAEDQEGLEFNASEGLYDIDKMSLNVSGVPVIRTADVKIIPDKGKIEIESNGRLKELTNARIEIDTLNSSHRLRDATIRITSRNHFEGSATYEYITARKDTFPIKMENFELIEFADTPSTTKGKKANQVEPTRYYTTAKASIGQDSELTLSPRMQFKGDIHLVAHEPSLRLDGFIRPMIKARQGLESAWITYKEAPGDTITITVDENLRNELDEPMSAGVHFGALGDLYPTFMSTKETPRDHDIYTAKGKMLFDEEEKVFRIIPPVGADGLLDESKIMTFDDIKGTMSLNGPLKLIPSEWLTAAGQLDMQVDSVRVDINSLLVFKLPGLTPILADIATKIVQTNLEEQNSTPAEAEFERLTAKVSTMIGPKLADEYFKKIAAAYKPLYEASPLFASEIVLANVDLKWSQKQHAYYSTGRIGVGNLGRNDVNVEIDGLLEIRRSELGDEFSLYLEVSSDVWYFIDYREGELGVVASDYEFNDKLTALSGNNKSKNSPIYPVDMQEKVMFVDRFSDLYQPAIKKLLKEKASQKKAEQTKKVQKKKVEEAEGF